MGDKQLVAVVGHALHGQPDGGNGDVENQVDLFGVIPAAGDAGANVGLELMIADDHRDRLAEHLAAEIFNRHLGRGHRSLAGGCRGWSRHVGQDADFDNVVRDLSVSGRR